MFFSARALFAALFICFGATSFAADDPQPLPPNERSCNSGFALCTSAPCIPDPSDPHGKAICTCEVTRGANYAEFTPCDARTPQVVVENDIRATVTVSTYAFNQAATKPVMTCPAGTQWTFCLDKPCTVDPKDPLRAYCTCDILRATEAFITYGGGCNTKTCDHAIWSGASVLAFQEGSANLRAFMKLDKVPASYCPGQTIPPLGQ